MNSQYSGILLYCLVPLFLWLQYVIGSARDRIFALLFANIESDGFLCGSFYTLNCSRSFVWLFPQLQPSDKDGKTFNPRSWSCYRESLSPVAFTSVFYRLRWVNVLFSYFSACRDNSSPPGIVFLSLQTLLIVYFPVFYCPVMILQPVVLCECPNVQPGEDLVCYRCRELCSNWKVRGRVWA